MSAFGDIRYKEDRAAVLTDTAGKSVSNVPVYWLRAMIFSALVTWAIGVPALFREDAIFSEEQALLLLGVHCCTLTPPVAHILGVWSRRRDLFHPSLIGSATFVVFHLLLNPLIYGDWLILATRNMDTFKAAYLSRLVLASYGVLFVSWCAYYAGHSLPLLRESARKVRREQLPATRLFLLVGLFFVLLGILGNMGLIGGFDAYLSKIRYFYERSRDYEEINEQGGSTKWTILARFLPVGMLVLAYGHFLYYRLSSRKFLLLAVLFATANVFLSCATGGRGTMLTAAFYTILIFNHSVRRISLRALSVIAFALMTIAFILGQLRVAAYYNTELQYMSAKGLNSFKSLYMTNYLGTLTLVTEVDRYGITYGSTAFAGVTGLLGGKTPTTTEAEIWYRLRGNPKGSNPRYGAPGELYFNFGWPGVIIGLFLIGALVKFLALVYERVLNDHALASGAVAVFASFTANFVLMGNLHYLPSYFTFYSVPFYFIFWAFRTRRC